MPLTPRNKTIVKAFIVALFASPVAINLWGWNCYLVWYGEKSQHSVGAANGVFHAISMPTYGVWGDAEVLMIRIPPDIRAR